MVKLLIMKVLISIRNVLVIDINSSQVNKWEDVIMCVFLCVMFYSGYMDSSSVIFSVRYSSLLLIFGIMMLGFYKYLLGDGG